MNNGAESQSRGTPRAPVDASGLISTPQGSVDLDTVLLDQTPLGKNGDEGEQAVVSAISKRMSRRRAAGLLLLGAGLLVGTFLVLHGINVSKQRAALNANLA